MKRRTLPAVAGTLDKSIAEHERGCLVLIGNEQEKIAPDNHLIAVLCDAVRLAREYVNYMKRPIA